MVVEGGMTMELLAVSKDAIRAHVIRYFHDVFGTDPAVLKPTTDVRKAYSYQDAAWKQLANVFNKLSWMRQLGVLLSPREMPALKTIEDLTGAIWGKVPKIVAAASLGPRFLASGIRAFPMPKSRAPASRRSGTSTRGKKNK
jgi:hypothetical protein